VSKFQNKIFIHYLLKPRNSKILNLHKYQIITNKVKRLPFYSLKVYASSNKFQQIKMIKTDCLDNLKKRTNSGLSGNILNGTGWIFEKKKMKIGRKTCNKISLKCSKSILVRPHKKKKKKQQFCTLIHSSGLRHYENWVFRKTDYTFWTWWKENKMEIK